MRFNRIHRSTGLIVLTSLALIAPRAGAADAVTIYSSGLDGVLVDSKDQALRSALALLGDRIMELPQDAARFGQPIPDGQFPAGLIQWLLNVTTSPMTLRVSVPDQAAMENDGMAPGGPGAPGGPPIRAQLTVPAPDQAAAEKLDHDFIAAIAGVAGPLPDQPAPDMPGLRMIEQNGARIYHGVMMIGENPAFVLSLGEPQAAMLDLGASGLPPGIEPALAINVDFAQLQPLFEMMLAQGGPNAEGMRRAFETAGFTGPNAGAISLAFGYARDRMLGIMRYENYGAIAKRMNAMPDGPLTADHLRLIPADALSVQLARSNPRALSTWIRAMVPPDALQEDGEPVDPIDMLAQQTGVHLERDILDHLGQTSGYYLSDSTGGGGLLSLVVLLEVTNAEGLNATIERVAAMVNGMARQHARGYVQIRSRQIAELKVNTLSFPGLPIPLEPAWAISDGYLFASASPQAVLAAVAQARNGGMSILNNERFLEAGGAKAEGSLALAFADTPRLARSGYGLMTLAAAALSNGIQSPVAEHRGPALVLPPYTELVSNTRASVMLTRMDGDDMVAMWQGDRSWLVNMTGVAGSLGGAQAALITVPLVAGITLPAIQKARETAKASQSAANLRNLSIALQNYAAEHNDRTPESGRALVELNDPTGMMGKSPYGPASDGEDYWFNDSVETLNDVHFPDRHIAFYDRAMYQNHQQVAVAFFDGHVQVLDHWAFEQLLQEEPNQGVDFNLPERW